MFSKVISYPGFWRSVTFLSVMFIVIYNVADVFMSFDGSFSLFFSERFAADKLLRFFSANIASGFVYGFIVSFFKFRGKIKQNTKRQESND